MENNHFNEHLRAGRILAKAYNLDVTSQEGGFVSLGICFHLSVYTPGIDSPDFFVVHNDRWVYCLWTCVV